ncbi:MAG: hypothetical protein WKG07_34840 [Hymenobacter sp.]
MAPPDVKAADVLAHHAAGERNPGPGRAGRWPAPGSEPEQRPRRPARQQRPPCFWRRKSASTASRASRWPTCARLTSWKICSATCA